MQTKKQSAFESVVNIVIGLITSFLIQLIIYPLLNIPVSLNQNIIITIVFFITSFIRSYFVRRYFNHKHKKENIQPINEIGFVQYLREKSILYISQKEINKLTDGRKIKSFDEHLEDYKKITYENTKNKLD
jgi:uncharacterized protein YacL